MPRASDFIHQSVKQLLIAGLVFMTAALNAEAELLIPSISELHHLVETTPNSYTIIGEEPYIVYHCDSATGHFDGIYLKIDPDMSTGCRYQLFWQTAETGFSEYQSFRFGEGESFHTKEFYLPLGDVDQTTPITAIRIDFEKCTTKRISVHEISLRSEVFIPKNKDTIIPQGIVSPNLPMAIKPHIRDKGPWTIHDMGGLGGQRYHIIGVDPYIVSPRLNVLLSKARGVYFKLRLPGTNGRIKLQLFWSTYARDYSATDNYVFWDSADAEEVFEFFIPFTNLPKDQLLKTIRLNFPQCQGCPVEVMDAKIISGRADHMEKLTPNLITYRLWNSVFDTHIPHDIVKRLTQDPFFNIFHICVVSAIAVLLIGVIVTSGSPKSRQK